MGYYATGAGKLVIPAAKHAALTLMVKSHPDWHYQPFTTLDQFFEDCSFGVEINSAGDLVIEYFDGKWRGGQEDILDMLGPFVVDGNTMHFTGEDSEMWGVLYQDDEAKAMKATITWDVV